MMASYSTDDFAIAALVKIVPGGYRLIDGSDTRFPGVREQFSRLALRHVGSRPSLVGFCGPDQDAGVAGAAAAGWAAANLVPTAIQHRVTPGVVVIAIDPPPGVKAGMVRGAPARTAIWTVVDGRLNASGRPPGAPSPRLVRTALAALERGEPPPSIGQVDVAERQLMSGRSNRRSFTLGGGAGIGTIIAIFLLLRFVPALLFPRGSAPPQRQAPACASPGCVSLGSADSGRTLTVAPGTEVLVVLPQGGTPACLTDSDAAVLQLEQCGTSGGDNPSTLGVYRAAAAGTATLSHDQFRVTVLVR
jgi:hypothetical protein